MQDHRSVDAPMSPERMQVRFGPRTVMVERFLLHLSKLRVAEWIAAGAAAETALCGAMNDRESARVRVSQRVVNLATATKGIAPRASYDALLKAALTAVFAIISREEIGPTAFHLLYAPFATIIPIADLEDPAS